MNKSCKKIFAVLACAAIVTSSAIAAYAAQAPASESNGAAYTATEAAPTSSNPVNIYLRKWYPAGNGQYAYELHYSVAAPNIKKLELRGSPTGEFNEIANPNSYSGYVVSICDGYLYYEYRVTLDDGRVLYQTFTYGSPSSSSSNTAAPNS